MQAAERADDAHARAAQWPIYLRPAELLAAAGVGLCGRERELSLDSLSHGAVTCRAVTVVRWSRHGVQVGGRRRGRRQRDFRS